MKGSELVKKRRKELGLTQQQLADLVGVKKSSISLYENGKIGRARGPTLQKLAAVLRIDPVELLDIEVSEERSINPEQAHLVQVPIYSTISCGTGKWIDEQPEEFTAIPENWARYGVEYFSNRAEGDSMYPLIMDGDLLVFEKANHIPEGKIGAFALNGQYYCKRIKQLQDGRYWLFSENPNYEPILITESDDFKTLGFLKFRTSKLQ